MIQPGMVDATELEAANEAAEADALLAAGTFGAALRESPEFAALLRADAALQADPESNAAINAFGRRQAELQMQLTFGTLDDSQRAELEALHAAMLACPEVAAYVAAQGAFGAVCAETAAMISDQIGIDFAANCRSGGCCG